ncbi:MAG: hypothetical protein QMD65_02195 [Patescibacteria group bacterium]|nr:hypothetical protein [Patescibacteria group bacterium]
MLKPEKKIFFDRSDNLEVAVDRLIKTSAKKVILNIPKNSVLGSSINNFQILKRESKTAGKELLIESVDEHILGLASLASIKAINPVFRIKERAVSDILPRSDFRKRQPKIMESVDQEKIITEMSDVVKRKEKDSDMERIVKKSFQEDLSEENKKSAKKKKPANIFMWLMIIVVVFAVSFGIYGLAFNVLPKAEITLSLKKVSSNFDEVVVVNSKVSKPIVSEGKSIVLPGELLIERRNLEMSFPSHGREKVETKAIGKLVIYNGYSSESQVLVASTRFESPTGKIFKLDKRIVVPGASIIDGKIVSSRVEATVTASEVGEAYNVPASSGWKIPGFKGTPKYDGFFAESLTPMRGGFIGEKVLPTNEDSSSAEEATKKALSDAFDAEILIVLADRFKLLNGASRFSILKKNIESLKDDPDKFGVFIEGEIRRFVFEEKTLKESFFKKLKPAASYDLAIKEMKFDYGEPQVDFDNGVMSLPIKGVITFWPDINIDRFRESLSGISEEMLKARISSLPGLDDARVSLWPFWVNWAPQDLRKINITVE